MPALRALTPLSRAAAAALILSAAGAALARQQQPPPRLVEEVEISGLRRLKAAELLSHVKTRPGDPYDHEQVMRDFQALVGLGPFDRRLARVVTQDGARGGVEIIFLMYELPVIESAEFEGLTRAEEGALLEGLRRRGLGVDAGSVYDPDKLTKAVAAMKELLRGRGWRRVEVDTRAAHTADGSVKLTFAVTGLTPMNRPPQRLDRFRKPDAVA